MNLTKNQKMLLIGGAAVAVLAYVTKIFKPSGYNGVGATSRPLYVIAREIKQDWGKNVNFAAKPYLEAMYDLDSINDNYGYDSARSIVNYFLSNASSWRGAKAKEIKAELKQMVKSQ